MKLVSLVIREIKLIKYKILIVIKLNNIGEEIIKLQGKLRDATTTLNECGSELVATKGELEQVKTQNNNYEQIISGLVEMLNCSKKEIEDMKNREADLLALANETVSIKYNILYY